MESMWASRPGIVGERGNSGGLLRHYRVLDLAGERGMFCGKLLADLGADVIKVEPLGGDPARDIGPFYHDIPDREKSLSWFALNTGKRGITLNVASRDGQAIFKKLVESADFVVESFDAGYLEGLGLGYSTLSAINPRIIMVSVTPFGQTGPWKDYQGADIVEMALGGQMFTAGDADRPPVRVSVPQAHLAAGVHAAIGALLALQYRGRTGEGQYVDVSAHAAVARFQYIDPVFWAYEGFLVRRAGPSHWRGRGLARHIWPCRDGLICFRLITGRYGRRMRALVEWMDRGGMAGDLMQIDWEQLDLSRIANADFEAIEAAFGRFFATRTKAELSAQAIRDALPLVPVNTPADLLRDEQLAARDFWVQVDHPELGQRLTYPGAPYKISAQPWRIARCAPLISEHNVEVYRDLGFATSDLTLLKQQGVI